MLGVFLALAALIVTLSAAWVGLVAYRLIPGTRNSPMLAAGLAILAFLVAMVIYAPAWGRARASDLAMGGLFWWLLLTVLSTLMLPGGSYLFVWPVVGGVIAAGLAMISPRNAPIAPYLGSLPTLALLPPTIAALCDALGPNLPFATALPTTLMVIALIPMWAKTFAPTDDNNLLANDLQPSDPKTVSGTVSEEAKNGS